MTLRIKEAENLTIMNQITQKVQSQGKKYARWHTEVTINNGTGTNWKNVSLNIFIYQ